MENLFSMRPGGQEARRAVRRRRPWWPTLLLALAAAQAARAQCPAPTALAVTAVTGTTA